MWFNHERVLIERNAKTIIWEAIDAPEQEHNLLTAMAQANPVMTVIFVKMLCWWLTS